MFVVSVWRNIQTIWRITVNLVLVPPS
jgi:hypothetical protein